ncbi:MAG TPA: TonB-dependent receptor [Chitinophagales bacterium]|nr:TonB-dependent receptor [Chitinophagales bacterium]
MRIVTLFTLLFITSALSLQAQNGVIFGKLISDKTEDGVAYATVKYGINAGVYTNVNGEFRITDLGAGTYTLEISCIGYEMYKATNLVVSQNSALDLGEIIMVEKTMQIAEVTITEQQKVYDSRYSGTNNVISAKTIQKIQPVGSEELLRMLPGVNISSDMEQSNRPNISIRGSDPRRSNKILLLEDGSPISPAPYLAPGTYYNVPADRLEGIQVIKGSDVLAYGSNTIYGVVNYITKRPPQDPTLTLKLTGGQRDYFTAVGGYGGTWNKTGAEIQTLYKTFGGYMDNSSIKLFNLSGKIFSEFGEKSTFYLKFNYQNEYLNTTWNGNTPFTFNLDPTINPFDADEFTSRRYGMDGVYNYKLTDKARLQTKIYFSDFYRDWWKQTSTVVHAGDVEEYVGADIYATSFSYLDDVTIGPDDYVRVGKVANGYESTTDSRWQYRVYGVQEKYIQQYGKHTFEAAVKWHKEYYNDVVVNGDSSKWARSGRLTRDDVFHLNAISLYARNNFEFNRFSVIPIIRYETILLNKVNALANATNPDATGVDFNMLENNFDEFTPGINIIYRDIMVLNSSLEIYGGAYKGFSSPTTAIAFNEVTNGEVTPAVDIANLKPEVSFNQEVGVRMTHNKQVFNTQLSIFNTFISNYYSPARSQAFQTLGTVTMNGIEFAINLEPTKLMKSTNHTFGIGIAATYMQSEITGGTFTDFDLFASTVFHTAATKAELIDKINADRSAYTVYSGADIITTEVLTVDDFDSFTKIQTTLGDEGAAGYEVPYVPNVIINAAINYNYKNIGFSISYNYVSEQYTEYLNFENETADGGIGKLDAYGVLDANLEYSLPIKNHLKSATFFVAGKNITNEIYKASRLNRATGGIFPAGFRQINGGLRLNF